MREPIVKGISLFSLILGMGFGARESRAQERLSGFGKPTPGVFAPRSKARPTKPSASSRTPAVRAASAVDTSAYLPSAFPSDVGAPAPRGSRYGFGAGTDAGVRRTAMYQDAAPGSPNTSGATPGTTEPTSPNTSEMTLPKSESAGGGGEPTEATEKAEKKAEEKPADEKKDEDKPAEEEKKEEEPAPAKDETKLLMNALGMEDSPVKLYGWIQNSYTGNTNGVPKNAINFGVNPNFLANRWMGNQYYLVVENPVEQNDKVNFGFRVDNLFGNDWQFNHMHGLFESSFKLNHFAGYDPAQMYAEVHLPYLTKGGTDIKGGRFYTILGYEVVPATGRPLLSVPYMFNYGQPFTHFGALATTHLTDRINVYNGAVNGWDRWINQNYKWNYLGGVTWTSKDGKLAVAFNYIFGPNQYPNFIRPGEPIVLPGTTPPPYLAGRRNPGYGGDWRTMFTTVLTYKWTDKLTQVMETDEGFDNNVPGIGPGGTNNNAEWYSFGNWFLYTFDKDAKFTGVWRSEVFRDNNGVRTGFADTFYEFTLGAIWKPKPYLWIRPEARYDWAQFTKPYNDATRSSQLTLAVDAILLY